MTAHAAQFLAQGVQAHAPDMQIVLPGKADGPGKLVGFGKDMPGCVQGKGGGAGDGLAPRGDKPGFPGQPTTRLHLDRALGQAVLHRLKGGDGLAELAPLFQVGHGFGQRRVHATHGFRGQAQAPGILQPGSPALAQGLTAPNALGGNPAHGKPKIRRHRWTLPRPKGHPPRLVTVQNQQGVRVGGIPDRTRMTGAHQGHRTGHPSVTDRGHRQQSRRAPGHGAVPGQGLHEEHGLQEPQVGGDLPVARRLKGGVQSRVVSAVPAQFNRPGCARMALQQGLNGLHHRPLLVVQIKIQATFPLTRPYSSRRVPIPEAARESVKRSNSVEPRWPPRPPPPSWPGENSHRRRSPTPGPPGR